MTRSDDLHTLPHDLPEPLDDGACAHLEGTVLPALSLQSTSGRTVALRHIGARWLVLYFYPRTGLPDREPPGGATAWNTIPGARGCTPQSCGYRDAAADLRALGAEVFGVSAQDTGYQAEAATRLHLGFELLSDANLALTRALSLPTFRVEGMTLIRRLTLVVAHDARIERCFYPVFPPHTDAQRVLAYLAQRSTSRARCASSP